MEIPVRESTAFARLRAAKAEKGPVFRYPRGLAVLDPALVREVNAQNSADVAMPDRLVDLARLGRSKPVPWKSVRAAWSKRLGEHVHPRAVADLEARLAAELDSRQGRELDLGLEIPKMFSRALVPSILRGVPAADHENLLTEQALRIDGLLRFPPRAGGRRERARSTLAQLRAGWAVRRELRARARGAQPRRGDLADPIVDLLPSLGADRAAFAVTTLLTAIAGPPGATAAALTLELFRRPSWLERLSAEHANLPAERFHASPSEAAPVTYRFVREALRKWSSPLVLNRAVNTPLRVGEETASPGEELLLSFYFGHHDPAEWEDPERFDPDRWLPGAGRGPHHPSAYAPFGWAPTSCIGAGLGSVALLLLGRLWATRYRLEMRRPESAAIGLSTLPVALGFHGAITRH